MKEGDARRDDRENACYCFVAAVALPQSWREQNLEGTKIAVDYCLHTLYKIYIGIFAYECY